MKIVSPQAEWTRCHECHGKADVLVEVGEEIGEASYTARLCHPCLLKALALAEQAKADEHADEQAGSEGKDLRGPF